MLYPDNITKLINILSYQFVSFFSVNDSNLFNLNKELYESKFQNFLYKLKKTSANDTLIAELINRLRFKLLFLNYYAADDTKESLDNIYNDIQIVIKNNHLSSQQYISLNILSIGILIRTGNLSEIQGEFLENNCKGQTFHDVLLAILPIINYSINHYSVISELTNTLLESLKFNAAKEEEFNAIKWDWYILQAISPIELKITTFETLKDKLITCQVNSCNALLAIDGFYKDKQILGPLDAITINRIIHAGNYVPITTTACKIITEIAVECKEIFKHSNVTNFLISNLDSVSIRHNTLLFLESITKKAMHRLPSYQITTLKNKLFKLINSAETFPHEMKIVTKILKNISLYDYYTENELKSYVYNIINTPDHNKLWVLSLNTEILNQYQVRPCFEMAYRILLPSNWIDRFYFSFAHGSLKTNAIRTIISVCKDRTLTIPNNLSRTPVEVLIQSSIKNPPALLYHTSEALKFFAIHYPEFFSFENCVFLFLKAQSQTRNNNYFVIPALGILIEQKHPGLQGVISARLLTRFIELYKNITPNSNYYQNIADAIIALISNYRELVTPEHISMLTQDISNPHSSKILDFLLMIGCTRPDLINISTLAKIEAGFNALLLDPMPINEYYDTFKKFAQSNIFEPERIVSFLIFHLKNANLNINNKKIALTALNQLLQTYHNEIIVNQCLPVLFDLMSLKNEKINLLVIQCLEKIPLNQELNDFLTGTENLERQLNVIDNETKTEYPELSTKQKFEALKLKILNELNKHSSLIDPNGKLHNLFDDFKNQLNVTGNRNSLFYHQERIINESYLPRSRNGFTT